MDKWHVHFSTKYRTNIDDGGKKRDFETENMITRLIETVREDGSQYTKFNLLTVAC